LMCHCSSGMFIAAATSSASMVLPVPGSPLTSKGRFSVTAALTASIKSCVATYWSEPWNFIVCDRALAAARKVSDQYKRPYNHAIHQCLASNLRLKAHHPSAVDMTHAHTLLLALAGLASMAPVAQAQDAAAGQKKASMCIGCHGIPGYQASFPEVHKVPMISGQGAKFVVSSLAAYKKGERKHPTMAAISTSLSDQDMADLGAFYEKNVKADMVKTVADTPATAPSSEVAALLTKGNCASCHGANFNKPIDASYPKIAGQHADYLYVALKAYQTDGNPKVGRANAIMAGQVKQFKLAELKAISKYIGSLPGDLQTVRQSPFR
jgi:cytochrome c553